nr:DMT family transporter [Acinetobacter sp. Marseille-Q1620]
MDQTKLGWIYGVIGVIIFAGSLPATRIAVMDFTPEFLTAIRAVIAGIFGGMCLLFLKQAKPNRQQVKSLTIVAMGVVMGFPLFTALALQTITSARAIVFIGLLPLATAIFGVLRAGEKPSILFWGFAVLGSSLVTSFMLFQEEASFYSIGDLYMIASVIVCGLGYAEGGKLSRDLGGWQVICWALVISLPFMFYLTIWTIPQDFHNIHLSSFFGLLYVSIFSMLIGFFFWYQGLALGGIAKVGQIQLLQPFIGFTLSALLLGEKISFMMILITLALIGCVIMARKFS